MIKEVSKHCRHCGRFMTLCWVEAGVVAPWMWGMQNNVIVTPSDEPATPVFYCSSCSEWDDEFVEVDWYRWLIYEDSIDFKEAQQTLSVSEYFGLLAEQRWMKKRFLKRPYRILPKI